MVSTPADPFGTAELRRRVLDGWVDAPARFREDANAEEDYALGGYRDRVVVELAQNAADAARRAGTPGRLRMELDGDVLTAANTGAPLTAAGVESLATLRASAKRDEGVSASTGRFGVGFSSVAAVSDDVAIASRSGAVRWGREHARAVVEDELARRAGGSSLADELRRRGGQVPLLRLPFVSEECPPDGYDTAVTLTLRDTAARELLRRLLDETSEVLLLALPDLAAVRVVVDGAERVLDRDPALPNGEVRTRSGDASGTRETRWRTVTRTGRLAPELMADRPVEERDRPEWAVTWAVAQGHDGVVTGLPTERVVHAPTPSEVGLALPALLIGTFPLSPDRRSIAPGPATDALVGEAARGYCDLLRLLDSRAALDLVPTTPMGGSEFDGHLRAALASLMRDTPFLATAEGAPVRPRDAVVVEGGPEVVAPLADVVSTALRGDHNPHHPALAHLRVHRVDLAELADMLADLDRDPEWWAGLYSALRSAGQHGVDLDELGALPVPLTDGRLVRSPRGLLVPTDDTGVLDPHALAPLGVRVVHPRAADPLLERLGAVEASAAAVLDDPHTREAVRNSLDADEPDALATPVLDLVAACGVTAVESPWLAELALRDDDGGYSVAGELLLPDSPLRDILTEDAPFGTVAGDLVERHGARILEAVGVLRSFTLVRADDVTLGGALDAGIADLPLDGLDDWAREVTGRLGDPLGVPPLVPELVGVADLEFVREDRWRQALELLAGSAHLRAAVVDPTRVQRGDGTPVDVRSYTAWWLRTGAVLDGRRPAELRAVDADPAITGLYDPAPDSVNADPTLARALGVRGALADLLAEPDGPEDLLERLADPRRHVERRSLRAIWSALARTDADRVTPPERVRAVRGGAIVVADAEETVVVDTPDLLPLLADRPLVLVPAGSAVAVADVLDLALASEEVEGRVTTTGEVRPVPEEVTVFLDTDALTYLHHDELTIDGVAAEWRYYGGALHAASTDGLARALCWAAGRWPQRHLVAAVLRDPRMAPVLLAEADLEDGPVSPRHAEEALGDE